MEMHATRIKTVTGLLVTKSEKMNDSGPMCNAQLSDLTQVDDIMVQAMNVSCDCVM